MQATEALTTVLVECEITDGMLDNECAVVIDAISGKVSLFADRSLIDQEGVRPALRTSIRDTDRVLSGEVEVLLPTETFETGSPWILVEATKLRRSSN